MFEGKLLTDNWFSGYRPTEGGFEVGLSNLYQTPWAIEKWCEYDSLGFTNESFRVRKQRFFAESILAKIFKK